MKRASIQSFSREPLASAGDALARGSRLNWVCAGVLLCSLLGCAKTEEKEPEGDRLAPVTAVPAEKVDLGEWTELLGTTQPLPNRAAHVSAIVPGHVLSVLGDGKNPAVAEGAQVGADQVIVKLDDRVARANRDKLAANLDEFKDLKDQAQNAVDLANIEVKRLEELSKDTTTGALVSRVDLPKARVALKDALSRQEGVASRKKAVEAELKALEAELEFYTLKAPIPGRLSQVQVRPGQAVTAGAILADVVDLGDIDILCFVPPRGAGRLVDRPARLVDQPEVTGKVVFVAVQAQAETGMFAVKVRFPNRDGALRAGSAQRVQVLTQQEEKRVTIPEAALFEDQEEPIVLAVIETEVEEKKQTIVRKLRPTLGVRDREHRVVEVLGLEGTDPKKKETFKIEDVLFVTSGGYGLEDGDKVKVEEKKEGGEH
jgi:membrane fusion protein, multidrug efflux system